MRLTHTQLILASALLLVILLTIITMLLKKPKKENFDFIAAKNAIAPNSFRPTFTKRVLYKNKVSACPPGTLDYGDEARQCLTSQYGPMIWRNDGGKWQWACPNGSTPIKSSDWNQKCMKGFSQRKLINGIWKCYDTEIDTGKTWENSDYYAAQQQCATGEDSSFTTRIFYGKAWVCPTGTVDTGFNWNDKGVGSKQCRILPGN